MENKLFYQPKTQNSVHNDYDTWRPKTFQETENQNLLFLGKGNPSKLSKLSNTTLQRLKTLLQSTALGEQM